MKHECWAVIYLRDDGAPATRAEYYRSREAAERHVSKATEVHGAHSSGVPRWRIAHMVEC